MNKDGVSIEISSEAVQQLLNGMYARSANLTPVMKRISSMMRGFAMQNFLEEGRPKWKTLSESTLKQRKLKTPKTLQVHSGNAGLKGSILPFHTSTTAGIGSILPYARIHQLGGWAGRNRKVYIPQRDYLSPTEDDMLHVLSAIEDYLTKWKR